MKIKDSNPEFGITHEKSMVIDDEIAFVKSHNWTTENLAETRDYAIQTDHAHAVGEIVACFEEKSLRASVACASWTTWVSRFTSSST